MQRFRLGVVLESTGMTIRPGIEQAAKWAVDGIQADGVGELSARNLTETGRRELRNLLKSFNLELSAIGCPIRYGLDVAEEQQKRLENIQLAMQLAYDLGAKKVVVPFPKLTKEPSQILRDSLLALSAHGDRIGTVVALEAGLDDAATVRDYLRGYETGCLQINFDPANFLMNGFDPLASAATFSGMIAHSHARDARRSSLHSGPEEVVVGAGDLDWMSYIATLESIEYRGFLTVERTLGNTRTADLAAGLNFLRRFVIRAG